MTIGRFSKSLGVRRSSHLFHGWSAVKDLTHTDAFRALIQATGSTGQQLTKLTGHINVSFIPRWRLLIQSWVETVTKSVVDEPKEPEVKDPRLRTVTPTSACESPSQVDAFQEHKYNIRNGHILISMDHGRCGWTRMYLCDNMLSKLSIKEHVQAKYSQLGSTMSSCLPSLLARRLSSCISSMTRSSRLSFVRRRAGLRLKRVMAEMVQIEMPNQAMSMPMFSPRWLLVSKMIVRVAIETCVMSSSSV